VPSETVHYVDQNGVMPQNERRRHRNEGIVTLVNHAKSSWKHD